MLGTKGVEASRILDHERYGSRIVLVDTPGFDDGWRTDEQTLELISKWLEKTYVELDPWDQYYPDNHICADIRNGYYYQGLCMSSESPIRGCPQHPTGISSRSLNSLVPKVQRMSSSLPQCGISPTSCIMMEINGRPS